MRHLRLMRRSAFVYPTQVERTRVYVNLKRAASAVVSMSTLLVKLLLLVYCSATRRAFVLLKKSTSSSTALFTSEKMPKTSGVTFS